MGDHLLKCQPRLLFCWEMFAGTHLSSPYQLVAALPEIILKCFVVPADPRSEPSNSVIIKQSPDSEERVEDAAAASALLGMDSRSASSSSDGN